MEGMNSRYYTYYKMLNQWKKNITEGRRVSNYLIDKGLNTIAIYGIGEVGKLLFEELKQDQLQISYFIDTAGGKELKETYGIKIVSLREISLQEKVDAIIVTPVYSFESIYDSLVDENIESIILSLEDIIFK